VQSLALSLIPPRRCDVVLSGWIWVGRSPGHREGLDDLITDIEAELASYQQGPSGAGTSRSSTLGAVLVEGHRAGVVRQLDPFPFPGTSGAPAAAAAAGTEPTPRPESAHPVPSGGSGVLPVAAGRRQHRRLSLPGPASSSNWLSYPLPEPSGRAGDTASAQHVTATLGGGLGGLRLGRQSGSAAVGGPLLGFYRKAFPTL